LGLQQDAFLKNWLMLGPISLVGAQSTEPDEEAQRKGLCRRLSACLRRRGKCPTGDRISLRLG
jgi:hypothetical protein